MFRTGSRSTLGKGYTLVTEWSGKACGVKGIRPGTYCEPKMTQLAHRYTVPMTRDGIKGLACLGFNCWFNHAVNSVQSAAYPKLFDIETQHSLTVNFIEVRGGVSLRPGGRYYPRRVETACCCPDNCRYSVVTHTPVSHDFLPQRLLASGFCCAQVLCLWIWPEIYLGRF